MRTPTWRNWPKRAACWKQREPKKAGATPAFHKAGWLPRLRHQHTLVRRGGRALPAVLHDGGVVTGDAAANGAQDAMVNDVASRAANDGAGHATHRAGILRRRNDEQASNDQRNKKRLHSKRPRIEWAANLPRRRNVVVDSIVIIKARAAEAAPVRQRGEP